MYSFFLGEVRLPVAPGKVVVRYGDRLRCVDLANGGEVVLAEASGKELSTVEFSALLPQTKYPFSVYTDGFKRGCVILGELLKLRDSGKPFRFIMHRKTSSGTVSSVNIKTLFKEIRVREEAGEGSDIYIDVRLTEYRDYGVKKVAPSASGGGNGGGSVTVRPDSDVALAPDSYTVVKGDSLWAIAQRFLGSGSRYTEIYNLNKSAIDARNKGTGNPTYTIYPGQVFRIS